MRNGRYALVSDRIKEARTVPPDGRAAVPCLARGPRCYTSGAIEDSLMTVEEGLNKAVSFLNSVLIREKLSEMWWAQA
jgi:hypothetical protein